MELHLPTIYLTAIVVSAALALVTAAAAWRNPALRLTHFARALVLSLVTFGIFYLRDEQSGWMSLVLGNLVLSLSLSQYAVGLLAITYRHIPLLWQGVPVVLVAVLTWALADEQRWRLVSVGMVLGLQAVLLLWALLQFRQSHRGVGYWFVMAGVLSCIGVFVVRAVVSVWGASAIAQGPVRVLMSVTTVSILLSGMVFLATGTLVMALEQMVVRIQRMALVDALTELANRRHVHDLLPRMLSAARRAAQPLTLLMLDVDHFKQVNDSYGHPAGDAVLRQLGALLTQRLRAHDVAARFGGEEFLVLLPNTDAAGGLHLASTLRETIEKTPITLPAGQSLRVTASIGLCSTAEHTADETAEAMIACADAALYQAKADGRNCVRLHSPAATAARPR